MLKVAFLTNFISPYRRPVFDRLAQTEGWDFRVFVNADGEFDRLWQSARSACPVTQSKGFAIKRKVISRRPVLFEQVITLHLPHGLWGDLKAFRPDVIISCELGPRTAIAAAYAKVYNVPLVIWSYQSRISATQNTWRNRLRKLLLGRADAVVGMGSQAREVLRTWNVPDAKIVDALNAADHDTLIRQVDDGSVRTRVDAIRQGLSPDEKLAIVVGRLVPMKGTAELVRLWHQVDEPVRERWRLVFIGNGPLETVIDQCESSRIIHAGHVDPAEIAAWYLAADLHIFPTLGDVWGLVVNEAMICGLPTLCSIHAGCCDDLIEDQVTGIRFDPTNESQAVQILTGTLGRDDLAVIGTRGRERVQRFTLDNLAESFRTAVRNAA